MKKINLLIVLLLLILMPYGIKAAEWQWSVPTFGKNARAYLWIPPHCEHVRGIIIGQQVILEHCFMQDPRIREAATKENLALVFLAPMCIGYDDFDPHGKGEAVFNRILSDLAEVSGYNEIANAPFHDSRSQRRRHRRLQCRLLETGTLFRDHWAALRPDAPALLHPEGKHRRGARGRCFRAV